MTTPLAFAPLGAFVVLECGCSGYRLARGPNDSVTVVIVRSCPAHPPRDELRYESPHELVSLYGLSKA